MGKASYSAFATSARLLTRLISVVFILALLVISPTFTASAGAADTGYRRPVAELLGKAIYADELLPTLQEREQKEKLSTDAYAAWHDGTASENFRALIWSRVFADYSQKRKIEPTEAEIESNMNQTRRFMKEDRVRREKEREALIKELASQSLPEPRRKQAQQYLDTLNSLRDFDTKRELELKDPAQVELLKDAEKRVASVWVKQWKINQALFHEFGGRIIFQQAGWEPIDAYRKLLEHYEQTSALVIRDRSLRDAVYSYFNHQFVYAEEKKARFYFEKPYWERTPEEMKAAGM